MGGTHLVWFLIISTSPFWVALLATQNVVDLYHSKGELSCYFFNYARASIIRDVDQVSSHKELLKIKMFGARERLSSHIRSLPEKFFNCFFAFYIQKYT